MKTITNIIYPLFALFASPAWHFRHWRERLAKKAA